MHVVDRAVGGAGAARGVGSCGLVPPLKVVSGVRWLVAASEKLMACVGGAAISPSSASSSDDRCSRLVELLSRSGSLSPLFRAILRLRRTLHHRLPHHYSTFLPFFVQLSFRLLRRRYLVDLFHCALFFDRLLTGLLQNPIVLIVILQPVSSEAVPEELP